MQEVLTWLRDNKVIDCMEALAKIGVQSKSEILVAYDRKLLTQEKLEALGVRPLRASLFMDAVLELKKPAPPPVKAPLPRRGSTLTSEASTEMKVPGAGTVRQSWAAKTTPGDADSAAGRESLRQIFQSKDRDKDGKLEPFELAMLLFELGDPHTPDQVTAILADYDENNDGLVDFDEFLNLCRYEGTKQAHFTCDFEPLTLTLPTLATIFFIGLLSSLPWTLQIHGQRRQWRLGQERIW